MAKYTDRTSDFMKNPLNADNRENFIFLRNAPNQWTEVVPGLSPGHGDGNIPSGRGSSDRDARLQAELNDEMLRGGADNPDRRR